MKKPKIKAPRSFDATHRGLRQSARKARLVMDMVRDKNVNEALDILKFTHNRAARHIERVIRSAMANAESASNRENLGLDAESLVVVEARVDQAAGLWRFRSRSRGSSAPVKRHFCHLLVKLSRAEDIAALKLYRRVASRKMRPDRIKDIALILADAGAGSETKPEPPQALGEKA